jgi:branched-chain amino acid transport system substrate-binding protein
MSVKRGGVVVVGLLLAALASAPFVLPTGAQAPPIRVGFSSDMSGASAITGEGVRWAATIVVEEINAKGGLGGRKVEAYFGDNKGQPGEAVSAVRKLADVDKVDVIIGQTHSGACLGAMPIVKEIGVPQVVEACSNPKIKELSGKGGNEWNFRVNLDDQIMANSFSRFIAGQGAKMITLVAQNDDFGRGAAVAYEAAFKSTSTKLVGNEFFDRGQADYRPLITRLKRANTDSLILIMLAGDASVFLKQYREMGMNQRIYSRGSIATAEFLFQTKDTPGLAEGTIEAGYWAVGLDPAWDKQWTERWKVPPRIHGAMSAIAFKYAVVPAIEIAIKKYGKVDRKSIRDALEEIDVPNTPVGPIKFDEYHQAHINMILLQIKNNQLQIMEKMPTKAS